MAYKNVLAMLVVLAVVPALRAAAVGTNADAQAKEVRFFLYDTPNDVTNGRQLIVADDSTLTGLSKSSPLIILIHGFLQNYQCGFPQDFKDAYLTRGDHPAVITVDWGEIACNGMSAALSPLCYPSAVTGIQTVADRTVELIRALISKGLTSAEKIHVVGVSLGAHCGGYIGSRFTTATGQKLARITGLDPAGPSFNGGAGSYRALQVGDAVFVDAIHTDVGSLGTTKANGDADYYPNGGKDPQPGCEGQSDTQCSHGAAARMFLQTIHQGGMVGYQCQSYEAFDSGSCNREATHQSVMGHDVQVEVAGHYYLHTGVPQTWSGKYTCY